MSDNCEQYEFGDQDIAEDIPLALALVLQRDGSDYHAIVRTKVPHLVVSHSPTGFEFGYGGSGPADLALNICQWYLLHIDYQGEKIECFDGVCYSIAWVLHQAFKREFIANAPHQGIVIPMSQIEQWFTQNISGDMKILYQGE